MTALVHRLPARGPDDVAPLDNAIANGTIDPAGVVAILGKTEGNGGGSVAIIASRQGAS